MSVIAATRARIPLRLLGVRYWHTWTALGFLRLLATLPYPVMLLCGSALGALLLQLPLRFRAVARRNIALCFPQLDAAAQRRLLTAHVRSLGRGLLEVPLAWWITPRRLAGLVRIEGAEHLHAALRRGHGVILLTAHFTSMELAGRTLLAVAPVSFLYTPTHNEALALALERCRTGYGGSPIPKDDIRTFIRALKRNECVWYAPDQSYRKKGAEMVPFFGVPAPTNTLTSRLAEITGAAVLPYFLRRLPGTGGYLATIHPPLQDFPGESSASDAMRFNRMIEAQARIAPEQYLWTHRRFKGLTENDPDHYGRQR